MLLIATFVSLAPKFDLTVESIMKSAAWVGHAPRGVRWSADGKMVRFSWAKAELTSEPSAQEWTVLRDGTGLKQGSNDQFVTAEPAPLPSAFRPSVVAKHEVYTTDSDLYIRDLATKESKRLTTSPEAKNDARLALNEEAVVYQRDGNLFRVNVSDGSTVELTHIKSEPLPAAVKTSEAALAKEQGELFKDFPRSGGGGAGGTSAGGAGGGAGGRRGRGGGAGFYSISPGGTHAYLQVTQTAPAGKVADVPNYITRNGYSEMISTYPKVGEPQGQSKLVIADIKAGTSVEIALPRPGRVGSLQWAPDGKHAYASASTNDHKDSWLFGFDPSTNKVTELWNEHDNAWIGGPGRFSAGWLPDSSCIYFESEKSGYSQLMTVDPSGNAKPLTEGQFEVSDVRMDASRRRFVFVSSEGSPFKRHIDAVSFDGGARTKLADYSADEDASFAVAPNGTDVAVVRSKANRPSELYVNGVQITTTPTAEWLAGPWIEPPVVMVPARDGIQVPARLYKPSRWRRGGPAVVFIHGAGYLQNVYDGWSHYFREYMFHHLLMDRGYAVLDIDYRGSAGYGKAWRTAIYRHMGGVDLDDAVDGAKYLTKELGVDPHRIGIYGGSYGGFITLMAMFTAPDYFSAGAALRPVSDWANYNHGYTSDILNLPQDDPEAYRVSSPIFHAEGLKGALLICHGMVDTNVHFQDTVRLVERLIELGKTNWEVAPYPVEDHAFRRADSWTDEYRRILDLFDRNIGKGYRRR